MRATSSVAVVTEQLGADQLKWGGHRISWDPRACQWCGKPAFMRDARGVPCHKVCAEPKSADPVAYAAPELAPRTQIPGLGTVLAWQPSPQSPFWRAVWPDRIPVEKFQRVWPEPAQIESAPHPAPEVPATAVEPVRGDVRVPDQGASLAAAGTGAGWVIRRAMYARGTDLDGQTVDSYALVLATSGRRVLVTWLARPLMLCAGQCGKPRTPTAAGLVRVHKDCDGGGQPAIDGEGPGDWEYSKGTLVTSERISDLSGIKAAIAYVMG